MALFDHPETGLSIHRFIEFSPIAILRLNRVGAMVEANASFAKLMQHTLPKNVGSDPQFPVLLIDFIDPEDRHKFSELFETTWESTGFTPPISLTLHLSNGEAVSAYTYMTRMEPENGQPPVMIVHMIDQTEQKNLEMRFAHSQKMQAVGQLAGGVAHDFNNLLTAMIGFSDLLLMRHPAGDPSFADIMQIKQNANRAANLVRQLLAFSRRQTLQPKTLDLTDLLAEISNLIRRLIGENIHMHMHHGRELGMVKVDQGQLEQVIINLAVNARDAMKDGGTLTIRTSNVTLTEADALPEDLFAPTAEETIPAGKYVLIEMQDTGTGIPPEVLKHIFEPFFSTKEVGSGTGLGLSTCYGIIKQTGGFIFVRTAAGVGTTFCLYLKHYEPEMVALAPIEEKAPHDLSGGATILLVEDETPVRIFAARALRNKGYEVLEADSGEHALEVFAMHEGPIDLIISDVVMPGVNGPNMVHQLYAEQAVRMKAIQVVFMSGYAEDAFVDSYGNERQFHFLPKPFTLKQLAEKVKEILH